MTRLSRWMLVWLCAGVIGSAIAAGQKTPVELGKIEWLRDYEVGVAKAGEDKKPILLLFQEVPG